ncbi:ATP-binding protein [Nocardioides bruguierae]|uniref:ATP-binding protein n=1 Tax=Nocardioides bruguierae TaxID=2945102 RepID=UPI0020219ED1|nr:ATP-binding protein [Nocardioides bruguierae]MCL8025033.1 ATP-binding protein [Nocardioides bruguierae]
MPEVDWEASPRGTAGPRAPLGRLSQLDEALAAAEHVDDVARAMVRDLGALPGVRRVGFGLTEGGGRRIRFLPQEALPPDGEPLPWCHIDAFEDVPITAVVRSGEPLLARLADVRRSFEHLVERELAAGSTSLAALPLPGTGSPIGAVVLFFEADVEFSTRYRALLDAVALTASDAVQRIRAGLAREQAVELAEAEEESDSEALRAAVSLPETAKAPGVARSFLREELDRWGLDDEVVESALLCVSEVVTNAVNHAHSRSLLRVSLLDGVLTVLVRDRGGSGEVQPPDPDEVDDPLAVWGRGLMLVEAIADRWGSERDAAGTTVWFSLDAAAS